MTYARLVWETLRSIMRGPFRLSGMTSWSTSAPTTSASGAAITEDTALTIAAVWNAVTLIAGSIGSLPLALYKRTADGDREEFRAHSLYRILHDEPNPEMSSMQFRETLMGHVLLWGNAYAEIRRDGANRVAALWPLHPSRVHPRRDRVHLYYDVVGTDGSSIRLEAAEIFHVKGFSPDGVVGYSVIGRARESLGYSMATERYGSSFFANASVPGGVFKHPGRLSEQAHKRLLSDLEERHRGPTNAGRLAILEEGMTWESMGIPPEDAQFLESRTFQVLEVARWFNVPPHKLKEMSHATFTNIEHQAQEFVQDTLRPWLVKVEQEMNRKLVSPWERTIQYVEHNLDGLLRGDTESRYRAYATARNWGWMNANTICRKENLPRLPGEQGEMYLVPVNMIPADKVGVLIESQTALPAEAEPVEDEDVEPAEQGKPAEEPVRVALPPTNGHHPPPAPPPENGWRRRAQLIAAQRAMLADVVRRHLARERDKARTAAAHGPERLRVFLREFYDRYADVFRAALVPAIQMHQALTDSDRDPEALARELVDGHVADSRRQLLRLLVELPEGFDFRTAVDALLARWELERQHDIPDALMLEEITHGV